MYSSISLRDKKIPPLLKKHLHLNGEHGSIILGLFNEFVSQQSKQPEMFVAYLRQHPGKCFFGLQPVRSGQFGICCFLHWFLLKVFLFDPAGLAWADYRLSYLRLFHNMGKSQTDTG
jgi:hypothetical protein